jgi:hypothetical protein
LTTQIEGGMDADILELWGALALPQPEMPKDGERYSHDEGRLHTSIKLMADSEVHSHLLGVVAFPSHELRSSFVRLAPVLKTALSCVISA